MASPQSQLKKLRKGTGEWFEELVRGWADGDLDWDDARAEMEKHLRDGHRTASRLGRLLGGDRRAGAAYDRAVAKLAWEGDGDGPSQRDWFRAFSDEVKSGRYGTPGDDADPPRPDAVLERSLRWSGGPWVATANETWIDREDAETVYTWRTRRGAQSCTQCASYDGKRYTRDELPAVPGQCQCLWRCGCWLETDDGARGFSTGARVG